MEGVSHEEGKLVGVLAHHGDPHSAGPVVVQVTQLVGQGLHVLGWESADRGFLDDVVTSRVDRSLPHGLRHQIEVISRQECI